MTLAEAAAALDRLLAGQSKEFHAASFSSSKRTPYFPSTCWSASASVPVSPPPPPPPSYSRASFLEYTQALDELSPSSRTEVRTGHSGHSLLLPMCSQEMHVFVDRQHVSGRSSQFVCHASRFAFLFVYIIRKQITCR